MCTNKPPELDLWTESLFKDLVEDVKGLNATDDNFRRHVAQFVNQSFIANMEDRDLKETIGGDMETLATWIKLYQRHLRLVTLGSLEALYKTDKENQEHARERAKTQIFNWKSHYNAAVADWRNRNFAVYWCFRWLDQLNDHNDYLNERRDSGPGLKTAQREEETEEVKEHRKRMLLQQSHETIFEREQRFQVEHRITRNAVDRLRRAAIPWGTLPGNGRRIRVVSIDNNGRDGDVHSLDE